MLLSVVDCCSTVVDCCRLLLTVVRFLLTNVVDTFISNSLSGTAEAQNSMGL